MNERLSDRLLKAELQIGRLVSDAESEKDTRARRNDGIDQEIKKIREDIHGNGREGLKLQIFSNTEKIEALTKKVESKEWPKELKWAVVLGVASLIVSVIAIFLKWQVSM
jgi:hypothetical protein